ncbi:helix-turn-helix domain-containing protein [Leptolyngbya ohadii]|uniref:helix-turn-helix domain-containing protein n=1 Tax=Leptolyngbya ohadii TaxID=1962290 RepID=UPI000B59EB16|nr:helix-turn-helix transcriptional regulator [Leptolyngbya ohadii]
MDLSSALRDYSAVTQNSKLNVKQRFGRAIRRRRRELDLSQEELAERAELNRTYLSDIERGEVNPSLEIIDKLANALGISVSGLFADYEIDLTQKSNG